MGNPVLKPFLQDVVQFAPLARVLVGVTFDAPLSIPPLVLHIGLWPLLDWIGKNKCGAVSRLCIFFVSLKPPSFSVYCFFSTFSPCMKVPGMRLRRGSRIDFPRNGSGFHHMQLCALFADSVYFSISREN